MLVTQSHLAPSVTPAIQAFGPGNGNGQFTVEDRNGEPVSFRQLSNEDLVDHMILGAPVYISRRQAASDTPPEGWSYKLADQTAETVTLDEQGNMTSGETVTLGSLFDDGGNAVYYVECYITAVPAHLIGTY